MLKLIKYEMIHSYRSFVLVFSLFLASCIIVPMLSDNVSAVGSGLVMMAAVGISIAVFVTIVRNYNTSMFKKPGYLTLTLPVSTHKLLLSKIIAALVWSVISVVILGVGIICLLLIISSKVGLEISIFYIIEEIIEALQYVDWNFVILSLSLLVVAGVLSIVGVFTLFTIVQTKYTRKHKTIIGFAIYIAYTFVMSILYGELSPMQMSVGSYDAYLGGTLLLNCVQIGVFYFLTIYILDHKIEIE